MNYKTKFTIEGLTYRFEATPDGSMSFYVIGGSTAKNAFTPNWLTDDETDYGMQDRGYFKSSLKVFYKLRDIILEYVRKKNPYCLYFTANNDKKQRVYKFLARKLAKLLNDKYNMYEAGNTFYYIRAAV